MKVLKELREDHAYSVRELAKEAGVSRTTLWKLEKQGGSARPSTVRKLSAVLGVTPRQLRGLDER